MASLDVKDERVEAPSPVTMAAEGGGDFGRAIGEGVSGEEIVLDNVNFADYEPVFKLEVMTTLEWIFMWLLFSFMACVTLAVPLALATSKAGESNIAGIGAFSEIFTWVSLVASLLLLFVQAVLFFRCLFNRRWFRTQHLWLMLLVAAGYSIGGPLGFMLIFYNYYKVAEDIDEGTDEISWNWTYISIFYAMAYAFATTSIFFYQLCENHSFRLEPKAMQSFAFYKKKVIACILYFGIRCGLTIPFFSYTTAVPIVYGVGAIKMAAYNLPGTDYAAIACAIVSACMDICFVVVIMLSVRTSAKVLRGELFHLNRSRKLAHQYFMAYTFPLWCMIYVTSLISILAAPQYYFDPQIWGNRFSGPDIGQTGNNILLQFWIAGLVYGYLRPDTRGLGCAALFCRKKFDPKAAFQSVPLYRALGGIFTGHMDHYKYEGGVAHHEYEEPADGATKDEEGGFSWMHPFDVDADAGIADIPDDTWRPCFALESCSIALNMAMLAYRTSKAAKQILREQAEQALNMRIKFKHFHDRLTDTNAQVIYTDKWIAVAFRGTKGKTNMLTDLKANPTLLDRTFAHLYNSPDDVKLRKKQEKSMAKKFSKAPGAKAINANGIPGGVSAPSGSETQDSLSHSSSTQDGALSRGTSQRALSRNESAMSGNIFDDFTDYESSMGDSYDPNYMEANHDGHSSGGSCLVCLKMGVYVHYGFYTAWKRVACLVTEKVQREYRKNPRPVIITGHSLGGALATCCAFDFRSAGLFDENEVHVYTFGSPRVGNWRYVKEYNSLLPHTFRVYTTSDPVPDVPPPILGYRHVSFPVALSVAQEAMLLAPSSMEARVLKGWFFKNSPGDHMVGVYAKVLEEWARKAHGTSSFINTWGGKRSLETLGIVEEEADAADGGAEEDEEEGKDKKVEVGKETEMQAVSAVKEDASGADPSTVAGAADIAPSVDRV